MDGKEIGKVILDAFRTIYPNDEPNGVISSGNLGSAIMGVSIKEGLLGIAKSLSEKEKIEQRCKSMIDKLDEVL